MTCDVALVTVANKSDFMTWMEWCLLHGESGATESTGPRHVSVSQRQLSLFLLASGQLGSLWVSLLPNNDVQLVAMHTADSAIGWIWPSQGMQNSPFEGTSCSSSMSFVYCTENRCTYSIYRTGRVLQVHLQQEYLL